MRGFLCITILFAVVTAEPPRYRIERYRAEKQELDEQPPYPASGFVPPKQFYLPARQELPPATTYGVPDDSYGVPLNVYSIPTIEYGAPEQEDRNATLTKEDDDVKTGDVTTESTDKVEDKKETLEAVKSDGYTSTGAYYILLPNSQLQRVQFKTENDVPNMAYTARLQYKTEERAPIYVYAAVPQYPSSAYVQVVSGGY